MKIDTLEPDEWELDRDSLKLDLTIGKGQFGVVRHGLYLNTHVAVKELKAGEVF